MEYNIGDRVKIKSRNDKKYDFTIIGRTKTGSYYVTENEHNGIGTTFKPNNHEIIDYQLDRKYFEKEVMLFCSANIIGPANKFVCEWCNG